MRSIAPGAWCPGGSFLGASAPAQAGSGGSGARWADRITPIQSEDGTTHALRDVFTTDDGLLRAAVIACTLGMGVFFARCMVRHMRNDGDAADRAAQGR